MAIQQMKKQSFARQKSKTIKNTQLILTNMRNDDLYKPKDLSHMVPLSVRTIRTILKTLYDDKVVDRLPDLYDTRTYFYRLSQRSTQQHGNAGAITHNKIITHNS